MAGKPPAKATNIALRKQRSNQMVRLHHLCVRIEKHANLINRFIIKQDKSAATRVNTFREGLSAVLVVGIDSLADDLMTFNSDINETMDRVIETAEMTTVPLIEFAALDQEAYRLYKDDIEERRAYAIEHLKYLGQLQQWLRNVECHPRYLTMQGSKRTAELATVAQMENIRGRLAHATAAATQALCSPAFAPSEKELQGWHNEARTLTVLFSLGVVQQLRDFWVTLPGAATSPPATSAASLDAAREQLAHAATPPKHVEVLH